MKSVLVFDVVGTLLDLSVLDPLFEMNFGAEQIRKEWFSEVLKLALTSVATARYSEFSRITGAALSVIENRYEDKLAAPARNEILGTLRKLPPFPDVKPALELLARRNVRLAALTNSGVEAATEALGNAGVSGLFERILSADAVQRLKPAAEPYRMAARTLEVEIQSLTMVAAHSWDLAGAAAAGCRTAFIKRPAQVLDNLTPAPAISADDLLDLVDRLDLLSAA